MSEEEIVDALAFQVEIVPEALTILTRTETTTNEPTLNVQAGVRIGSVPQLLFSDQVQVRVTPLGRNSAVTPFAATNASNGAFSTLVSLGSGEAVFRFDVASELFGLHFDRRQVARRAPVDIDVVGALATAGEAALSNGALEVINGQTVRLRIDLRQGNAKLAGQVVYLGTIGEGDLSITSVRTNQRGQADVTFTPPDDKIGRTKIVATYFEEGRLNQDIFEVGFTSTAVDATVVPPVSAEESAAAAQINAIVNQAALEALQGNKIDFVPNLIPPMRTWHTDGVMVRISQVAADPAALSEAVTEYLRWRSYTRFARLGRRESE